MLWADVQQVDTRQYSVFFLRQKLANLNASLGFGRNNQPGLQCSRAEKTGLCAVA